MYEIFLKNTMVYNIYIPKETYYKKNIYCFKINFLKNIIDGDITNIYKINIVSHLLILTHGDMILLVNL